MTAGLATRPEPRAPRLAFIGTGWIGLSRMKAIIDSDLARVVAIAEPHQEMRERAGELAPAALPIDSAMGLRELGVDGAVIATPSAMHAEQVIACLEQGIPVFCQKPLGRTAAETLRIVNAARERDLLLGVDMSYRFTAALGRVYELVHSGDLGEIFAAELAFHNAYGPDKPWSYDMRLSGGGCVMDLGIHLVDALLWLLDWPRAARVHSRLMTGGRLLNPGSDEVEDYAAVELELTTGVLARLCCSWKLPVGSDAHIEMSLYGTRGGARMRNVGGSFYHFVAERLRGTATELDVEPPDAWGGRAAVAWARSLTRGRRFDPEVARTVEVMAVLDRIYGREGER